MSPELEEILDDLFHGCAWAAFVEQAVATRELPDVEMTRRRAFELYEEALAEKHTARAAARADEELNDAYDEAGNREASPTHNR